MYNILRFGEPYMIYTPIVFKIVILFFIFIFSLAGIYHAVDKNPKDVFVCIVMVATSSFFYYILFIYK